MCAWLMKHEEIIFLKATLEIKTMSFTREKNLTTFEQHFPQHFFRFFFFYLNPKHKSKCSHDVSSVPLWWWLSPLCLHETSRDFGCVGDNGVSLLASGREVAWNQRTVAAAAAAAASLPLTNCKCRVSPLHFDHISDLSVLHDSVALVENDLHGDWRFSGMPTHCRIYIEVQTFSLYFLSNVKIFHSWLHLA